MGTKFTIKVEILAVKIKGLRGRGGRRGTRRSVESDEFSSGGIEMSAMRDEKTVGEGHVDLRA